MVKRKTEEIKEREDINVKVEEGKRERLSWSRRRGGVGGGGMVCFCVHTCKHFRDADRRRLEHWCSSQFGREEITRVGAALGSICRKSPSCFARSQSPLHFPCSVEMGRAEKQMGV